MMSCTRFTLRAAIVLAMFHTATSFCRRRKRSSVLTQSRTTKSVRIVAVVAFCIAALVARYSVAQIITDDFNDGNDAGWTRYDPVGMAIGGSFATFAFPSGGYQVAAPVQEINPALGQARAGSFRLDLDCTDFYVAVDLVDWDESPDQLIGLMARASDFGPGMTDGYVLFYET